MCHLRHAVCFILPPHIESKLAENPKYRARALRAIEISSRQRALREAAVFLPLLGQAGNKHRTIFDTQNGTNLPGVQVRDEGDPPVGDQAVNQAYDYSGDTYDFYQQVFNRNSVDDHGLVLKSTVHYDQGYDNAFWNGQQMIYGDGDGELFQNFTGCIDVVGHELTHGVTQNEAQLVYQDQPGALNESISDVFGSLVKQWVKNQTADQADWLIGEGLFTPAVRGKALRSMKDPGTAYDDPNLGKDPQPGNMRDYVKTNSDNGGVHINSGIPNRAFCLAALNIGGFAWQKAGLIWYRTLTGQLKPTADFQAAADATVTVAANLFGAGSDEQKAVIDAWKQVGLIPQTVAPAALKAPAKAKKAQAAA
ncbi:MAG TPA: M4 family metallopeptidase [Candidatus Angelobacter sp.]|nr:M4 family metallopeptidase [Candidatus Angelobacter sp.]